MFLRRLTPIVITCAALALAPSAFASGGHYVFAGGTAAEQQQVREALDASSFDWDLVPVQVTIHIARGIPVSYSLPGQTWLDADLLDSGTFSWGVVQMEYAQQVQFTALDPQEQAVLTSSLGARQWCYENPALSPGSNACERFAATLAWSYWPSAQNSMRPAASSDWSASMDAKSFRLLLQQLIGAPDRLDGIVSEAEIRASARSAAAQSPANAARGAT